MTREKHPEKEKQSPVKEAILRRIKLLYIFFLLFGVAIIVRAVWLQVGSEGDSLRSRAQQYSYRVDVLEAARGDIFSDDGRLLATSIPYFELRMDMRAGGLTEELFESRVEALGGKLAEFFKDKSAGAYTEKLRAAHKEGKRYHLVNRRKVDYLELQIIKQFPLFELGQNKGGFICEETHRRVYPHGELARRTIGFVNQSGVKLGVEGGFDDYLKGMSGLTVKQKISGNFWTPIASPQNIDPVDGMDVITTINIEMQDMVQQALREWVADSRADWGCAAVMEVKTGEIKAMANITRQPDGSLSEDYNYVIGMSMEPGSTFKMPVLMALLEDGKMPLTQIIDTEGGRVQIGPARVVDTRIGGYGPIPLQTVFEKSSNIGMAKAVNQIYKDNPSRFVNYLNTLGIHKPLELQLAGEARPLFKHPGLKNGWDGMTLTMMSYGYALRMAPIHTLTIYNAVANDGVMVKPVFVRELRQQGQTVARYQTDTINEAVCSPRTIAELKKALEGVVENGTGQLLKNKKYSVAAKTGTAQIAMGRSGYTTAEGGRHYLGSMAGYFPADNPQYTIVVALKTYHTPGSGKPYYGTQLAGPIFKAVCDRIFTISDRLNHKVPDQAIAYREELKALPGSAEKLSELGRQLKITGMPAIPGEGLAALDSGKVIIRTLEMAAGVPDLKGLTIAEALPILEETGLRPRFTGMGTVRAQSLEPGEPFEQGSEILITLGR